MKCPSAQQSGSTRSMHRTRPQHFTYPYGFLPRSLRKDWDAARCEQSYCSHGPIRHRPATVAIAIAAKNHRGARRAFLIMLYPPGWPPIRDWRSSKTVVLQYRTGRGGTPPVPLRISPLGSSAGRPRATCPGLRENSRCRHRWASPRQHCSSCRKHVVAGSSS